MRLEIVIKTRESQELLYPRIESGFSVESVVSAFGWSQLQSRSGVAINQVLLSIYVLARVLDRLCLYPRGRKWRRINTQFSVLTIGHRCWYTCLLLPKVPKCSISINCYNGSQDPSICGSGRYRLWLCPKVRRACLLDVEIRLNGCCCPNSSRRVK